MGLASWRLVMVNQHWFLSIMFVTHPSTAAVMSSIRPAAWLSRSLTNDPALRVFQFQTRSSFSNPLTSRPLTTMASSATTAAAAPMPVISRSRSPSRIPCIRAFHASLPLPRDHHFDTLKIVRRLRAEGFSEEQAVALMRVLNDVIEESIQNLTRTMVLREGWHFIFVTTHLANRQDRCRAIPVHPKSRLCQAPLRAAECRFNRDPTDTRFSRAHCQ